MNTETETPSEYGSDTTTVKRVARLRELVKVITRGRIADGEFSMRIPADEDRDADLVLSWAARKIESLSAPVGDVGEVVERLKSMSILMLYKLGHKKAVEDAIDLLQSQAREIAEQQQEIDKLKREMNVLCRQPRRLIPTPSDTEMNDDDRLIGWLIMLAPVILIVLIWWVLS